jgi:hypothetical protein
MESMSSVYSNAIDVKDTLDAVGHTYAGVDSEMQYDKIKGDMFNSAFTQEERDSSMHFYAASVDNDENGALSKLGYTFLRTFMDFKAMYQSPQRNIVTNATSDRGGLSAAVTIISEVQGRLTSAVTQMKGENAKPQNDPTYIYIAALLDQQESWTKDPDKFAWTIVQAILRSASDLWRRVAEQAMVRRGAIRNARNDTVGKYLNLMNYEHQTQASQKGIGESPNGPGTDYDKNVYAMENSAIMKSQIESKAGSKDYKNSMTDLEGGTLGINFMHDAVKEIVEMVLKDKAGVKKDAPKAEAAK